MGRKKEILKTYLKLRRKDMIQEEKECGSFRRERNREERQK
jgi:hypothetical protein